MIPLLSTPLITVKKTVVITSSEKAVLDYIQALTTFPVVTLIIFLVAFFLFKKEIKILIGSLQSFKAPGGFEGVFAREVVATAAAEAALSEEKAALAALPAGADKETKARDLEQKQAVIEERIRAVFPDSSTPLTDSAGQPLFGGSWGNSWRYRTLYDDIEPVIREVVKEYVGNTDTKVLATDMMRMIMIDNPERLYQKCIDLDPRLKKYSKRHLMRVINDVVSQYAPLIEASKRPRT